MSSEEQNSELYKALNSCGRRERQLSASNLDHHRDILIALFGQAALKQEHERRIKAQLVEDTMREIIESYADGAERRAAEVVFASQPEFYGLNVNQRIAVVETKDHSFSRDQYARLRKRVVTNMASALPYALASKDDSTNEKVLASSVQRVASQLYRYAQPALAILEAFNDCIRFEEKLSTNYKSPEVFIVEIKRYDWLFQFGEPGKDFRLVPTDANIYSMKALWTFVYYQRFLRELLNDQEGRDYLRGKLPIDIWVEIQKYSPFTKAEIDLMETTLDTAEVDEAFAYFETLSKDDSKKAVCKKWLTMLANNDNMQVYRKPVIERKAYPNSRDDLIWAILGLCMILQNDFPKETLTNSYTNYYKLAVFMNVSQGLIESNVYKDDDDRNHTSITNLINDILSRRPSRYRTPPGDVQVWCDDATEREPWAY